MSSRLGGTCMAFLLDLTAKCPKPILEEVDEPFIWPKTSPRTAVHPVRPAETSPSAGRVQPLTEEGPGCVLPRGGRFRVSSGPGLFHSSSERARSLISVWEGKWVWSPRLFTTEIYLKCFRRFFFNQKWREFVKPCALTCC